LKTIIATRHAKSSWANMGQQDFDRPLNERGLRDAPIMSARLLHKNIEINGMLTSTALRAKTTCALIANAIGFETNKILFSDRLYHAPPTIITDVLAETDDDITTLLFVCHNNGLTHWINQQAGTVLEHLPTCGMVAFAIETLQWSHIATAKKTLLFYDYPKLNA
jgi:phosphohistidine phosphatase